MLAVEPVIPVGIVRLDVIGEHQDGIDDAEVVTVARSLQFVVERAGCRRRHTRGKPLVEVIVHIDPEVELLVVAVLQHAILAEVPQGEKIMRLLGAPAD